MNRCLILALGIFLLPSLAYAAQVSWTGGGDGKTWNDPKNWSNNAVPTSSDDVTIGVFTVTANGDADFANTLTCKGTLILDANMSITSTSSFTNLTLMAGTLAPGGALSVTVSLSMSGGSIIGPGTINLSGTSTVSSSGSLGSTISVTNSGTINIMGSGTGLSVGSVFNNKGTVNIQSEGVAAGVINSGTINNNGTIAKTVGTGSSILSASLLNNAKEVTAQTGTLQVYGGNGSETGTFNADAGATLEFAPGEFSNFTLNPGTTFTGSGTVHMTGGIWTLAADITVSTATLQFDASGSVVINGSNNLTINSAFVIWNSGSIGGSGTSPNITISNSTVVQVLTTGNHTLGRNLDLLGTVNMNGDMSLFATIKIEEGATFNIQTDNGIIGNGTINNAGTFEKTGGDSVSLLSLTGAFNTLVNSNGPGTVTVNTGVLEFSVSGPSTIFGNWTSNSFLSFSTGTYTLGGSGISFVGSGTTTLASAGAIWDVESISSIASANFQFSGGTIQGSRDLTIKSPNFNWSGGNMTGSGSTTISAGTTATLTSTPGINGRIINNLGKVNLSDAATTLTLAGATWNNAAGSTFAFEDDAQVANGQGNTSTFNNDGTVEKTGSSTDVGSDFSFNGTFNNNATGKVLASAGALRMRSAQGTSVGAWTAHGGARLLFWPFGSFPSTWTINAGTTMTGGGFIVLASSTWNLTANLTVSSAKFAGGTSSNITGPFDLILTGGEIFFKGLVRQGQLTNGQPDGTITIPNPSAVTVDRKGGLSLNACTLDNSATITVKLGTVSMANSAVFQNESAGTVNLEQPSTDPAITGDSTTTITNLGTIAVGTDPKARHVQQILTNGIFNNFGTVSVLTVHTLELAMGTGASKGTHTVAAGGILEFQAGTYHLQPGTEMGGAGAINLGGTWSIDADTTVNPGVFRFGPQFGINGGRGTIVGSANLTISSPTADCFGGSVNLTSPGVATVSASTILSTDSAGCGLSGGAINVFGKMEATQGTYSLGGNLNLQPGSFLDFQGSNGIVDGGSKSTLNLQGTLKVVAGKNSGAGGPSIININGSVVNSGTVVVNSGALSIGPSLPVTYTQTGGSTVVKGGATLTDSQPLTINGGTIGGSGSISGTINNTSGNLQAGIGTAPGILNLGAPLSDGSGSTTTEVIAGTKPSKFDQIVNSSTTTLGGLLIVTFGTGFSPSPSDTFPIETYSSATGTFSSVKTPDPTCTAQVTVGATSTTLQFVSRNVSVQIQPTKVTLKVNAQQQFTDTVTHGCGNGVTWKVKEGSVGGSVTQTGLYTAPGNPGTFHVVVTSVADPTKRATATVTVNTAANKIVVTPQAAVIEPGGTLHLKANQSAAWSVAEGVTGGSVTHNGTYTAAVKPGLYHVMATSTTDATNHATVNIAVVSGKLKSAYVTNLDKNSVSVLAPVTNNGLSTGQLREVELVPAGRSPVALAISSQGTFLLSGNRESNDVARFRVSSADGTLRPLSGPALESGTRPIALALDRAGKMAFVANRDSDDISVFSVDRASGQMVLLGKQALDAGDNPSAIAVHPTRPWIYVSSAGANSIRGFAYDPAGMLRPLSQVPLPTGVGPTAALIDTAGRFLFIANRRSGDLSVFAIDRSNGIVQEVKGSPFAVGKGVTAIALDVTGSYLFVADHESNAVATLQIDSETGGLTLLGRTPLAASGPSALAVDPSGQYVYVTSDQAGGVASLKLNASTGTLTRAASTQSLGRASAIVVTGSRAAAQAP